MDLKIWKVSFNDGGWHSNLPEYIIVSHSKEDAIEKCLADNPNFKSDKWFPFASEFKIDGYVIEIFNQKDYNRLKNIDKIYEK